MEERESWKSLEKEKKRIGKESRKAESDLYSKWQEKWQSQEDVFVQFYKASYEYSRMKRDYNKKRNFQYKKIFIIVLLILTGLFIWDVMSDNKWMQRCRLLRIPIDFKGCILEKIILFGGIVLIAAIVNKWIDINKYQETWVRHSKTVNRLNSEMLKYVEEIGPYEQPFQWQEDQRRTIFIKSVLKIWNDNSEKFTDNMENKEKELMDVFEYIKEIKPN